MHNILDVHCPWLLYMYITDRFLPLYELFFLTLASDKKNQHEKFLLLSAFRRDTILFFFCRMRINSY